MMTCGAGLSAERGKLAGRCADLEAELAAASSEVDELRQLLDGVMTEKAALAARCSSLESQVRSNHSLFQPNVHSMLVVYSSLSGGPSILVN